MVRIKHEFTFFKNSISICETVPDVQIGDNKIKYLCT